jgi:hypothetical protein
VLVRCAPPALGVSEKPFRFKEKTVTSIPVIIGLVVILICVGFVVLMMVSEWSQPQTGQPLAENPAEAPKASSPARKAAPAAAKKKPAKKAAAKPVKKAAKKKK